MKTDERNLGNAQGSLREETLAPSEINPLIRDLFYFDQLFLMLV